MQEFLEFRKMITPILIHVVFWIGVVASIHFGLNFMFYGSSGAFIIGLMYLVLGPIYMRIFCELIILLFRIYDTLNEIKDNTKRG